MKHFEEITPEHRWKNDVLDELRGIRKLLERVDQTFKQQPEQLEFKQQTTVNKSEKRPYQRRGAQ